MGFKIHWRAPLQPKGFLKIVEFFLAIIAFSLVAGFTVETSVDFSCGNNTYNYTLKAKHPFRQFQQTINEDSDNGTETYTDTKTIGDHGVPQSAEFFVGWGVLTLFYCIIAVLVYMLVTANEQWEKAFDVLVVVDIVFHIVWILLWFIASVDWAVGFNRLDDILNDYMTTVQDDDCAYLVIDPLEEDRDSVIYVQAQIAVVFGFLIQLVWAVNIGWLVIDTSWFINWRASRGHSSL